MKKTGKISLLVIFVGVFFYTLYFLYQKSQEEPITYETEKPFYSDIINKTLATGNIKPREEIEIKPQVSGIIQELYVEAGEEVQEGDLIAKIKVIPNMIQLNNANNRVEVANINLENAKKEYERNKNLFDHDVISVSEYNRIEVQYRNAQIELNAARRKTALLTPGTSTGYWNAIKTPSQARSCGASSSRFNVRRLTS